IKPQRIPCVIENVRGMSTSVTNDGSESSMAAKLMCPTIWNIATPTSTSTGAVAYVGTTAASGEKKKQGRKPPIRIPAMLSTYAVPDEVPASPPTGSQTHRRSARAAGSAGGASYQHHRGDEANDEECGSMVECPQPHHRCRIGLDRSRIAQADRCEQPANSGCGCQPQVRRNGCRNPFAQRCCRDQQEEDARPEHHAERDLPRHLVLQHDRVGEER